MQIDPQQSPSLVSTTNHIHNLENKSQPLTSGPNPDTIRERVVKQHTQSEFGF